MILERCLSLQRSQTEHRVRLPLEEIGSIPYEAEGLQSIQKGTDDVNHLNVTAQIKEGDNIGLVSNRAKEARKI